MTAESRRRAASVDRPGQDGREVVVVSGAAGAIGSATVRRFVAAGFLVIGLDRVPGSPVEGDGYRGRVVDLRDEAAVAAALETDQTAGTLAHVVGIAGGALPVEPPTQHDPMLLDAAKFAESLEANLTTQFGLLRATLPWLRRSVGRDRSVTFTSSFNALSGWGMPAYSAAKAGLIGMMQALTGPLGAEGIRVNVVAPGTIRTPRTERIWAAKPGHFEHLAETTALGRLGEPDDVADAFFAVATQLRHMSGQVLVIDGGQLTKRS